LSLWVYGINEGYWIKFWPERPLPESYGEVLDAWIEWERDIAQDYHGVGFVDIDFDYSYQIYTLVSDYVMQHDTNALPNLKAAALRSALEKMNEVYEIRRANGRSTSWDEPDTQLMIESETGPGRIFTRNTQSVMNRTGGAWITYSDSVLYGVSKDSTTLLPIPFDGDSLSRTSGRMFVYVVNPYSKHREEAIHFIECMAQIEADPKLYYAIHPNANAPYPDANYEQIRETYQERRDQYAEVIQRAIEEGQEYSVDLENRLQYYEDWLEDEGNRWLIHQETIDAYRQTLENAPLNLHAESPYVCDEGTTPYAVVMDACRKYAQGQLSLDGFLDEISSKMKMVYLEDQ
jgi:hypothetical protein